MFKLSWTWDSFALFFYLEFPNDTAEFIFQFVGLKLHYKPPKSRYTQVFKFRK